MTFVALMKVAPYIVFAVPAELGTFGVGAGAFEITLGQHCLAVRSHHFGLGAVVLT